MRKERFTLHARQSRTIKGSIAMARKKDRRKQRGKTQRLSRDVTGLEVQEPVAQPAEIPPTTTDTNSTQLLLFSIGLLVLAIFSAGCGLYYTFPPQLGTRLESIPNPRPHGWTVDQTGTLDQNAIKLLNGVCESAHQSTGAEIAVVMIHSTGGENPRSFATRLFNHWGIGSATEDNGVLVFAAINDRKAEIILGDGVDQREQVNLAYDIMQNGIVPRFRMGDAVGAMLYGARRCATEILGAELPDAEMISRQPVAAVPERSFFRRLFSTPSKFGSLCAFSIAVIALVGLIYCCQAYVWARRTGTAIENEGEMENRLVIALVVGGIVLALGLTGFVLMAALIPPLWALPGGGGVLAGVGLLSRKFLRYRPRFCPDCKRTLQLLDEQIDHRHLAAHKQTEERINSVDYDVWACRECNHVTAVGYANWLKSYSRCPNCHARALKSSRTTVRRATKYSEGKGRIDTTCQHCSYHTSRTYTIPKVSESSSSSGSSYSSSSSSGGFGGGSSSGSGASGSW
jgi:uncharacterized protein